MRAIGKVPAFPLLIANFPVISLLAHNLDELAPPVTIRSFAVNTAVSLAAIILLRIVLRDWTRAALLISVGLLFTFSYGHLYGWLEPVHLAGVQLGRHRYLLPLWLISLGLSTLWALRLRRPHKLVPALNLLAATLLALPLTQVLGFLRQAVGSVEADFSSELGVLHLDGGPPRDIYYIIPDAYTRDDTLLSFYQYDNSQFLHELEDRGFYIARCAQSNYARTSLSLASSLNLDYLPVDRIEANQRELASLIQNSLVRRELERLGYSIVAFETTYPRTEWLDADIFLRRDENLVLSDSVTPGLNAFEAMLFKSSIGLAVMDANTILRGDLLRAVETSPRWDRYRLVMYTLDKMEDVPAFRGPKLVFVHINAPHEPYIFERDGSFIPDQDAPIPGYGDQVHFINERLLRFIDIALRNSSPKPLIILQGDHGGVETWGDSRRMNILSAYLFPDGGNELLYPTITPVNTFRVIFDNYFGSALGLLPDVSYHSTWQADFEFEIVRNSRDECP